MAPETMTQTALYPRVLAALVESMTYRPGWSFTLEQVDRGQGSEGLTLCVVVHGPDSYDHARVRSVMHYRPVPPAAFLARDWQRWLLSQVLEIETHEACEHFTIDGAKPYAPNHGPGRDPYVIVELGTALDAATSYRGDVNPPR